MTTAHTDYPRSLKIADKAMIGGTVLPPLDVLFGVNISLRREDGHIAQLTMSNEEAVIFAQDILARREAGVL